MNTLSTLDTLFLRLERRHAPFHVGALSLFRPPADVPEDFGARLAARLNDARRPGSPFDRRVVRRRGLDCWEAVRDFDLGRHFVHIALKRPVATRNLPKLVSRLHGAPLDHAHPLWCTYLIDGLEDGRIATYSKIHHAVADGIAGLRLMLKSMSPDEGASREMPAPWQPPSRTVASAGVSNAGSAVARIGTAVAMAARAAASTRVVAGHLQRTLRDYRSGHPQLVTSFQAPRCLFNQPIGAARQFALRSICAARIRRVAERLGGGVNDVVLTLCAGALRGYLLARQALPDRPLIAAVPVSTRADDGDTGNQVAAVLVDLATHRSDALARFHAIKACMDYQKARVRQMTATELLAYSAATLAPGLLTLLPGARRTVANVVISHVPGPRQPMYWQGCLLEGLYPASLLLDGFALNITLVSRHDAVDFGVLAYRRGVPQLPRLLGGLEQTMRELERGTR